MIDKGKWPVLGVNVDAVDYEAAVKRIVNAAKQKRSFIVTALPVHGIMTGARDERHRYRLNRFDLLLPDGQPVRWALNLLFRTKLEDRVYGPNLMLALCERLADEGLPIFLFGSRNETLEKLRAKLTERYPKLIVCGVRPGEYRRVTPIERTKITKQINSSGAALVFVGLGCPRQEIWAYENSSALNMPLVCVGAAFDFHAGTVRQAPPILQRAGLEWAFRLAREPKRLWRRYILLNPLYIGMVAAQAAGFTDFAHGSEPPKEDTNWS
jgi:N-acetylglucosaminyldiphosphoundecaprenol N-acetyl-beta-D-mannosaminyltransferase